MKMDNLTNFVTLNGTSPLVSCNSSSSFVHSLSFKVVLIFEILIGFSSSVGNGLLMVAVWRVSVFHANLRWLLINLSLNLFWYASAITLKATYFLTMVSIGQPCLLVIESIACKRWELLYVTPFLNTIYSLIALGIERLLSTVRYRSYDRSSRLPWLACLFIVAIWMGTLGNQLAVLSTLRSQLLPICLSFLFAPSSTIRGAIVANSLLESIAVIMISILHIWNLHKRDRVVNAASMKYYTLAARFQIIQNVNVNKLLLPSIIAHACAHIPYMAFLTVLLLGMELSLEIKVILVHCGFVWFTAYGTTHAWLAFVRHPRLKTKLKEWAPEVIRKVIRLEKTKVDTYNLTSPTNLHFDMLTRMWATNERNTTIDYPIKPPGEVKVMFSSRVGNPKAWISREG